MTYEEMTDKYIIQECVRYILKDGLQNTDNANWCTMASDIGKSLGIPLLQIVSRASDIEYWLSKMEPVADVDSYQAFHLDLHCVSKRAYENDWVFDVIYCLEYCPSIDFDYEWDSSFEEDYGDTVGTKYEDFMKKLDNDEQFERMF